MPKAKRVIQIHRSAVITDPRQIGLRAFQSNRFSDAIIEERLRALLGQNVDFVEKSSLRPRVAARAQSDLVAVFA